MEIGAIKYRARDTSTDISYKRDYSSGLSSTSRLSRSTKRNNEDEHSEEYKKIMSNTDKYLTMAKYTGGNDGNDANKMMEEERRSKAYSKIIGAQTAQTLEADSGRATLTDIFCNTNGFSAKTVQAIYKETLYKEEGRPKNYSWRKDMEAYEENLEKMNEHKKTVRDSTRATRDVCNYKSTNDKIRDYDRESRRNVDVDVPVIRRNPDPVMETKPIITSATPSYDKLRSSTVSDTSYEEPRNESVRGNWRKDMAKFEENLSTKKVEPKITAPETKYSWNQNSSSSSTASTRTSYTDNTAVSSSTTATTRSSYTSNTSTQSEETTASSSSWRDKFKKYNTDSDNSQSKPTTFNTSSSVTKPKDQAPVISTNKIAPSPSTASTSQKVSTSVTETKSNAPTVTVASKQEEKITPTIKKSEIKEEVKPVEVPQQSTPKWKKPEAAAPSKEESKPAEAPKPKWKKPETTTATPKEDPKPAETPKAAPKWKKTEATPAPKVEIKQEETPKAAPKWKKPSAPKEEPKPAEPEKPVPKWKKPATPATQKEEPKPTETPKAVPKWKKTATTTTAPKEEPKPAEKPVPKWKKPAAAAPKEEPKPAEPEKPTPKWKKPASSKPEEPKPSPSQTKPTQAEVKPIEPAKVDPIEPPKVIPAEPEPTKQPEPEPVKDEATIQENKPAEEASKEEKKEENEEEEDVTGMRAMRKEQASKFTDMEQEFAAGASKLSALRAKMKALRMKSKASSEADAEADRQRQG